MAAPTDPQGEFTERTPRIVAAAKLHRARERRRSGLFLAEGGNAVDAAVATGAARDVYATAAGIDRHPEIIRAAGNLGTSVHRITPGAAAKLAGTVTTPGIFAVCGDVLWRPATALRGRPRLVSVPVATSDPGNAGTLIRLGDAMGADAVLFAGETVDPQGPKAVRASAGSLFQLPVCRERDIARALERLRAAGLQLVATAADGELSLDRAGEELGRPTAWLFGNEAHGLDGELLAEADLRVRIPIRGRAESLNLATAAAICLHESARAQDAAGEPAAAPAADGE